VDKWKAKAEALDEVAFMVGVWRVQWRLLKIV